MAYAYDDQDRGADFLDDEPTRREDTFGERIDDPADADLADRDQVDHTDSAEAREDHGGPVDKMTDKARDLGEDVRDTFKS